MPTPFDPPGEGPTPPASEPIFKTTLSYADGKRTRRKTPRRASLQVPGWRRRIFRLIGVGAAIVAIIYGCLAVYDIAGMLQQGNAPLAALQQFCAYETH